MNSYELRGVMRGYGWSVVTLSCLTIFIYFAHRGIGHRAFVTVGQVLEVSDGAHLDNAR